MEKQKTAFLTGINGQDGSYLAEQLLEKGYKVYGLYRRSASPHFENISHIKDKLNLICGDLTDPTSINDIFSSLHFNEVYNLAAQSFVGASFSQPHLTFNIDAMGVLNLLEAIRKYSPDTRFYQACHDESTKVVTQDGIKEYKEVKVGDLVYSINETTKLIELKKVTKIHEYDNNQDLTLIKSRRINQCVTDNHTVLLRNDNTNQIERIQAKDLH